MSDLRALEELLEGHVPEYMLTQYVATFREHFCDTCEVISLLTTDEFRELGVAVGHRRRIRTAAASLATTSSPQLPQNASKFLRDVSKHEVVALRNPLDSSSSSCSSPVDGSARGALFGAESRAAAVPFVPQQDRPTHYLTTTLGGSAADRSFPPASPLKAQPVANTTKHRGDDDEHRSLERRSSTLSQRSKEPTFRRRHNINRALGDKPTSLSATQVQPRARPPIDPPAPVLAQSPSADLGFSGEVQWIRLSGNRPTLEQFLADMHALRKQLVFPPSFDRLFFNNKPMPFVELSTDGGDGSETTMVGLLLRIPDLSDEFGTSITTITNRVCFMIHLRSRVVVTYHACEEDPFEDFQREWVQGRYVGADVDKIADLMIRRVLRTYNKGVTKLRDAVDELETREPGAAARKLDDTARVQKFSIIAKKAAVYKRCADASRDTLLELEAVSVFADLTRTLCDGLGTVASMTDELASNALGSIDLTIALSEFKSNGNLKNFTYMSILLQPISLGTGWYGMNWAYMPELDYEHGYYVFAAAIWIAGLVIFSRFVLHELLVERIFMNRDQAGAEVSSPSTGAKETQSFWKRLTFRRDVRSPGSASAGDESEDGERPWKRTCVMLPVATGMDSPMLLSGVHDVFTGVPMLLEDEKNSKMTDDVTSASEVYLL